MNNPTPIFYDEDVRPQDTERALKTVTPTLKPNETNPRTVVFQGSCPRCGHEIVDRQWIVVVAGALKLNDKKMDELMAHLETLGVDRSRGDETFDLTCSCNVEHPYCPPEKKGCGARFCVRVIWP